LTNSAERIGAVSFKHVKIAGGFWGSCVETTRTATLPAIYRQMKDTRRFDAWKLDWQPGQPDKPHYFWDSDAGKWIEAAGYSLAAHPDPELEARVDEVVALIEQAQQPDGYLNIYFTNVEPGKRWTNLREMHEMYCAGHLVEGAVAYYQATGKRALLDVMCRYIDHIDARFGPDEGKKRGYGGHPEIELALVKLYHVTGEERYLRLSKFFVDERGQQPHYYDIEAQERGSDFSDYWAKTYRYVQAHLPLREQEHVTGHAVRACYLYAGMADVAFETEDETLAEVCRRLWNDLTEKHLYITGGVGQTYMNEGFSFHYDLPNETAYAETCAAISLVFWAQRMFHLDLDSRYIDVMERALYNGVLSGVSLDGKQFFYANPLSAYPHVDPCDPFQTLFNEEFVHYRRSDWFRCACCPPNLARLLMSMGQYFYSAGGRTIYAHLYGQSSAQIDLDGDSIQIEQQTRYPWDGEIQFTVEVDGPTRFTLALRVPGWCRDARLQVNGIDAELVLDKGYAKLDREWRAGDRVTLTLAMPVERIVTDPKVRQNAGRVALQRGPVVYCLEEVDNGAELANVVLPRDAAFSITFDPDLFGGVNVITGDAVRLAPDAWAGGLYQPQAAQSTSAATFSFKAIPYYLWANRQPGEMRVWIREG
jgi:uncharacterized protein